MTKNPKSPEQKQRNRKRRIIFYGSLALTLFAIYEWQPYEIDLVPRKPKSNPRVTLEQVDLFNPANRVLIVTAHPDDSELMVGATLLLLGQKHIETHQVICTDGDKGYYPFEDAEKNRRVRRAEATEAKDNWHGSELIFLGYADGRLRRTKDLPDILERQIARIKPTHILCFDGSYPSRVSHGDHRYSGEATEIAASHVPSVKWLLHFQTNAPNYFLDIQDVYEAKQSQIKIHKSQFFGKKLTNIQGMISNMAEKAGEDSGSGGIEEALRAAPPTRTP